VKSKHITPITIVASLAAISSLAFAEPVVSTDPKMPDTKAENAAMPKIEEGTLTTSIRDSATFSILAKALKAAELDTVLGQKGSYTIFAPTDEAFGKLKEGTLDKLMLPENKEKLRSLLLYHVVAGNVMAADLKDMAVKTMNGEMIKVDVDDDGKEIEINEVRVASADVVASNGVMHSIGEVLVPKSLDEFANLED